MEATREEDLLSPVGHKQAKIDIELQETNINHSANKLPLLPIEKLEEKQHCDTNIIHRQQRQDNHLSTRL